MAKLSTKWYYVPRFNPVDEGRPSNQVVVYELHPRHPIQKNGNRYVYAAEGDIFEAYPTSRIRRLEADSIIKEVKGPGDYPKDEINPDSIMALDVSNTIRDKLRTAGLERISEIVAEIEAGEALTDYDGIAEPTEKAVIEALVNGGHLDDTYLPKTKTTTAKRGK